MKFKEGDKVVFEIEGKYMVGAIDKQVTMEEFYICPKEGFYDVTIEVTKDREWVGYSDIPQEKIILLDVWKRNQKIDESLDISKPKPITNPKSIIISSYKP